MKIPAIIGAVLLGALLILVGAMGARWFAPLTPPEPQVPSPQDPAPPGKALAVPKALDLNTLRELLSVIEPNRRQEILASDETFKQFAEQEALNQAVLAAAYANGAEASSAVRVLMERAAQRVLAETYLNQVVRLNLDPAFPTPAQVREAYDKNPEVFRVPERMHLWQIFIPLPAGADDATFKSAWKLARRLSTDLRAGKADFATLAKQHSAHAPSRVNDGYMGLVKVADLLPPIAAAAAKLEVGAVSEPIATEAGLHVIKRGPTVDEELLDFETIEANVRERLLREAALKVRDAAVQKIAGEYPITTPLDALPGWREKLTREQAAAPTPVSPEAKP